MDLKVFKALWGDAEMAATRDDLERIKNAGYDGIEFQAPNAEPGAWKDWCASLGLEFIGMVMPRDMDDIAVSLERIAAYDPIKITMHTGRDKMTFEEGSAFVKRALEVESDIGIPVAHETHRHRIFYTPWSTAQYLDAFPNVKLCVDFSHWCCVTESLLADDDIAAWVKLACQRAIHIHGRVGWEEGPQVADPRAPEVEHYVERHESWWDEVWTSHHERDEEVVTFTPEYGPPGYMPTLPYTRQPVADLWEVCLWAANRQRERWSR